MYVNLRLSCYCVIFFIFSFKSKREGLKLVDLVVWSGLVWSVLSVAILLRFFLKNRKASIRHTETIRKKHNKKNITLVV